MQSKLNKYVMLIALMGIIFPVNYYLFKGEPDSDMARIEEQMIKDITGIDVKLTPQ
jgi:hypothetical protein